MKKKKLICIIKRSIYSKNIKIRNLFKVGNKSNVLSFGEKILKKLNFMFL